MATSTRRKIPFPVMVPAIVLALAGGWVVLAPMVRVPVLLFAAIGSAVTAGVFFAFSTIVMPALGQQTPASGIATMQSINIVVINPWFMGVFWGPAVVGVLLAIAALPQWNHPRAIYALTGVLFYSIGAIGVTIVGNIPLNDALAAVTPESSEAAALWSRYLTDWTLWNHLRTVAAVLASTMFTLSLGQSIAIPN